MRTAMYLVDSPLTEVQSYPQPEQNLSLDEIYGLKAEVSALREELARAERTISQKDVLLRNGRVREMALRMESRSGIC